MLQNKNLVLNSVSRSDNDFLQSIEVTYNESFPSNERRDFSFFLDLMRNDSRFKVYAGCIDNQYVGFITCWVLPGFIYIEHFAIDSAFRNGGIGGSLFHLFLSFYNFPIVLEVELPVDELTSRRVRFYQRLGLILDHHDYLQPPYHSGDNWLPLRLMTFGGLNLSTEYENVRDAIYSIVYGVNCLSFLPGLYNLFSVL